MSQTPQDEWSLKYADAERGGADSKLDINVPPAELADASINNEKDNEDFVEEDTSQPRQNASDNIWSMYMNEARRFTTPRTEPVVREMGSLLIFAGLFSATVTAFILVSYQSLQPNSQDTAVQYLAQISQQLAAIAGNSSLGLGGGVSQGIGLPNASFQPTGSSIRVNSLWVVSLLFSLACALGATLVQYWITCGPISSWGWDTESDEMARLGHILHSHIQYWAIILPALMHISLFLFFAGLIEFFQPINGFVARLIIGLISICAITYLLYTILPFAYGTYGTPITIILWFIPFILLLVVFALALIAGILFRILPVGLRNKVRVDALYKQYLANLEAAYDKSIDTIGNMVEIEDGSPLDKRQHKEALEWLLAQCVDLDRLQDFFGRIGALISDKKSRSSVDIETIWELNSVEDSTRTKLGTQVGQLFSSYLLPADVSDVDKVRRVQTCMHTLSMLIEKTDTTPLKPEWWQQWFGRETLQSLRSLKDDLDPTISFNARLTSSVIACRALLDIARRIETCKLAIEAPPNWDIWTIATRIHYAYRPQLPEFSALAHLLPTDNVDLEVPYLHVEYRLPSPGSKVEEIRVAIGSEPRKALASQWVVNEGSLVILNSLLTYFMTRQSNPTAATRTEEDRIIDTLRYILNGRSGEGTSPVRQRRFVETFRRAIQTHLSESDKTETEGEEAQEKIPARVLDLFLPYVSTFDEPECAREAQELVDAYRSRPLPPLDPVLSVKWGSKDPYATNTCV